MLYAAYFLKKYTHTHAHHTHAPTSNSKMILRLILKFTLIGIDITTMNEVMNKINTAK